ncbi:MAG: UPF0146 family protein [Methanothrix sp.]
MSKENIRGPVRGGADLARFILARYSGKVVEVGVGAAPEVALSISGAVDLVATDRRSRTMEGIAVIGDDIFSPDLDLYRGASLIYSIRPPLEIQIAAGRVALEVGADLIVRDLAGEVADIPGLRRTLVNFGEARFYLFSRSHPSPSSPSSSPSASSLSASSPSPL